MSRPTIKLRDALKRMRQLTEINVPFSFTFISYSEENQSSDGYKQVSQGLLRPGYRSDQSVYSERLIAYTNFDNKESNRQFNVALLMTFNEFQVIP
ncbi:hypothetical protein ACI6PS_02570 [Flavobacterium sp. PLA-1-15]|uniref:hypothetical protein n=1 Tax=Flavobacterium sp. PLA-1-15 TaxID=3380533 RepID=UPI003B78EBDF